VPVSPKSYPLCGYGEPYSQDMRENVLMKYANGTAFSHTKNRLQQQHIYPYLDTIWRWLQRIQVEGHGLPYHRSGNKRATILRGPDLLFLALYRAVFPKAKVAEINAFLETSSFNITTPTAITETEKRLGRSKRRGSTTTYQALLPIN